MTQKNRTNLGTSIDTNLASGTNITAAELRPELKDIVDSSYNILTDTVDVLSDGSTNRLFTNAEKTKLTGVATGATANSADATLLNRANHTGTQLAATVSDFSTATGTAVNALSSFRETIEGSKWPGVVKGSVSAGQRITNATALQAAINAAATQDKIFTLEPGMYQINLTGGLVIPTGYDGFHFKGSRMGAGSHIVQFATNTPALVCGSDIDDAYLITIDGVKLSYGVDQTGQTGADLLRIKGCWRSKFMYIEAGPDFASGNHKPYRCCNIEGGPFYFQNTMEHCKFGHGHLGSLYIQKNGTGNVWRDLYLGGGAPTATAIAGSLLYIRDGYSAFEENIFQQINIEWAICKNPMYVLGMRNATFESIHFEGNILSGDYPALIYAEDCQLQFTGLKLLDNRILDANIGLGVPSIFNDGYGSNINIDGFGISYATDGYVDMNWDIVQRGSYEASVEPSQIQIRSLQLIDVGATLPVMGNMRLTERTAIGNFTNGRIKKIGNFQAYGRLPIVKDAQISIVGNYTLYGFLADGAYMISPTNAGAIRTITLSDRMGVAGSDGETTRVRPGTTCSVVRGLGTADAFALNVVDHLGNNIATLTASGATAQFVFDGRTNAWVNTTTALSKFRTVTGNTTLTLADIGGVVELNSPSAITITIPPDSTFTAPADAAVAITQIGAGQVTVVASAGVTIRTAETLKLKKQYASASLYRRGANEWVLVGNLETV